MTSGQLEALYNLVAAMRDEAAEIAKTEGTREAFGVKECLGDALYDIHGAFSYLAIEEGEAKV
jgi:hypothetical protein